MRWTSLVDTLSAVGPPFLLSRAFIVALALLLSDLLSQGVLPLSPAVHPGVLSPLSNAWDAGWYISIARDGYDSALEDGRQHNYAFFPLLPMLMRLVVGSNRPLSDYGLAGVVINHGLFLAALVVLYQLTLAVFRDPAMGRRVVWIVAVSPWAFVFSMAYTEALFLFLSATALWGAWRLEYHPARWQTTWLAAAVTLGCVQGAALTRPPGVLLAVAVAWIFFMRARGYTPRQRAVLVAAPFLSAALAFAAFVSYISFHTRSPGAVLQAARGWGGGFWPDLQARLASGDLLTWVYAAVQFIFLVGWVSLTVAVWRLRGGYPEMLRATQWPPVRAVPGVGAFRLYGAMLLGILTQVPAALSLARYALMSFPCAWVLATVPWHPRTRICLLAGSLMLQGIFFWLSSTIAWPP